MTLQEIKELQEKITAEEMDIYQEECRLFELEETTTDVVKKMKYVGIQRKESQNIEGNTFEEIQDVYVSFIEELGKYYSIPILWSDTFDQVIDTTYFEAETYYMHSLYMVENSIRKQVRSKISKLLRPNGYERFTKTVQCEMLTLFMDGQIDWVTLQKITYQGREI